MMASYWVEATWIIILSLKHQLQTSAHMMWRVLEVDIISQDTSRLKHFQVQTIPLRTSPSPRSANQVPSARYIPNCWLKCGAHLKHPYVNVQLTAPASPDWMAQCPLRNKYALVENILVQMSAVLWTAFPVTHAGTFVVCFYTVLRHHFMREMSLGGYASIWQSKYFISNS